MTLEIIRGKDDMRQWSRQQRNAGRRVALVPTMGSLHAGHLTLVNTAAAVADVVVVSIYLNPSQFAPTEDLSTYPSNFAADVAKLTALGSVAAVFSPPDLYHRGRGGRIGEGEDSAESSRSCLDASGADGHETWIRVERLEKSLCGKSRPIFFRGVATVVSKLFNVVEPDVAVFGKKDYQQWRIICRMVRDLDFPIEIIGSEIVRDADGLALSSRNVHLSPEERAKALSISRSLLAAKEAAEEGQRSCQELKDQVVDQVTRAGGRIDYVELVEQESLSAVEKIGCPVVVCVAAWFGNVRLIDNVEINP